MSCFFTSHHFFLRSSFPLSFAYLLIYFIFFTFHVLAFFLPSPFVLCVFSSSTYLTACLLFCPSFHLSSFLAILVFPFFLPPLLSSSAHLLFLFFFSSSPYSSSFSHLSYPLISSSLHLCPFLSSCFSSPFVLMSLYLLTFHFVYGHVFISSLPLHYSRLPIPSDNFSSLTSALLYSTCFISLFFSVPLSFHLTDSSLFNGNVLMVSVLCLCLTSSLEWTLPSSSSFFLQFPSVFSLNVKLTFT